MVEQDIISCFVPRGAEPEDEHGHPYRVRCEPREGQVGGAALGAPLDRESCLTLERVRRVVADGDCRAGWGGGCGGVRELRDTAYYVLPFTYYGLLTNTCSSQLTRGEHGEEEQHQQWRELDDIQADLRLLKKNGDSRIRDEFTRFLEGQQSDDTARHQQLIPLK